MNDSPELSIVLPAYNEAAELYTNVQRVCCYLEDKKVAYELLIVNDGSKDTTLEEAKKLSGRSVKVLTYPDNQGKGFAIHYGMKEIKGKYVLFMDVDLSTDLNEIEKFLKILRMGSFDLVIGNRKTKFADQKIRQPFIRRFLGKGFTCLASWVIGRRMTDFTCGFKMFTKSAAQIIFSRQRVFNWAFDAEIMHIAHMHNLRVHEVPVQWSNRVSSKVRLNRDILGSLAGLGVLKLNSWMGVYR